MENYTEMQSKWVLCPVCGGKTRDKIRKDTELNNFPLFCPKCKQESLIAAKDLHVSVIRAGRYETVSKP